MIVIPILVGTLGTVSKSGQNTEKSPADLKRFAVTQTTEKEHQLMLA